VYEATVAELPDVATCGDSYGEAYESAVEAIVGLQKVFAAKGKTLPAPAVEPEFSGRITLRMSKSMHGTVHRCAQNDGVSLNQWIVEAVGLRLAPPARMSSTGSVFVFSPMRQANSPALSVCAQQAQLHTFETTSGSFVFLTTDGVVEGNSVQPQIGTNFRWAI
jgi:predicted RNase H-like HicB family nuclease